MLPSIPAPEDDHAKGQPAPTSVFQWTDVTYGVGQGKSSKEILKGISGSLGGNAGGEVCAILGPSGSGKTSLLNVLANRLRNKGPKQRVGGKATLDGKELVGNALRKRIAYVMQQDLLFATQTPREALLFSALLRLPRSTPISAKKEMVEKMIDELGLRKCADTYVGDGQGIRGISGGEKKRTAVGIELVMKPKLIFLDEPTSGLDSFSAQGLIKQLVGLANNQGCNVLCTIHQPSSEVFHTFKRAMVLYNGKCLYFGSISELSTGLRANDCGCPAEYNLADHTMSLIQTSTEESLDKLKVALTTHGKAADEEVPLVPPSMVAVNEADSTSATVHRRHSEMVTSTERAAGIGVQLYYLSMREFEYVWRNKPALIASIIAPIFLNLLFGGIFAHVGDVNDERTKASCDTGEEVGYNLQAHYGAVAQVMIGGMFGAAQPLLLKFPLDRGIFLREYATSMYGALPYFLSKTVVEVPQAFMVSMITWACFYPIVGLQGSFIFHVLVYWAAGLSAASTALLVGCFAANPEAAQQAAPPIFVLQLLFAGVFLPVESIPCGLRWIQYLSSLKYGINLVIINEFGNQTQVANDWPQSTRTAADQFMSYNDVEPDLWWLYMIMLVGLFMAFRTLGVVVLAWKARNFY